MKVLPRAEKQGSKYQNPVPTEMGGFGTFRKALPRMLFNKEETFPKGALGPFHTDATVYATPPASGLRVTWFGHACSLVEMDGLRVLIDPVWERRAGPFAFLGPKRFFAPTLALEQMPALDAVLISHDHYDHLGASTIRQLSTLNATAHTRWVCALGVGKRLRKFGVPDGRITELDWTQSASIAGAEMVAELKITAWPSRHFSGRTPFDRFTTLWGSYVLEGPKHRVLYGADTGYWEGFGAIAAQYEGFDLSMLQVGAFDPLWHDIHMSPEDSVRAYCDMGGVQKAGLLMPVHWGLFNLALHGWRVPIERMITAAGSEDVPLFSPTPGQPTEAVRGREVQSDWWKVPV